MTASPWHYSVHLVDTKDAINLGRAEFHAADATEVYERARALAPQHGNRVWVAAWEAVEGRGFRLANTWNADEIEGRLRLALPRYTPSLVDRSSGNPRRPIALDERIALEAHIAKCGGTPDTLAVLVLHRGSQANALMQQLGSDGTHINDMVGQPRPLIRVERLKDLLRLERQSGDPEFPTLARIAEAVAEN